MEFEVEEFKEEGVTVISSGGVLDKPKYIIYDLDDGGSRGIGAYLSGLGRQVDDLRDFAEEELGYDLVDQLEKNPGTWRELENEIESRGEGCSGPTRTDGLG